MFGTEAKVAPPLAKCHGGVGGRGLYKGLCHSAWNAAWAAQSGTCQLVVLHMASSIWILAWYVVFGLKMGSDLLNSYQFKFSPSSRSYTSIYFRSTCYWKVNCVILISQCVSCLFYCSTKWCLIWSFETLECSEWGCKQTARASVFGGFPACPLKGRKMVRVKVPDRKVIPASLL